MAPRIGFEDFKEKVEKTFFQHPVVAANAYTSWFAQGLADPDQVRELIVQFSVFSNHFLVAQVKRLVNAATEEGERCARNILVNECGVGLDPRTGSAEGRTFSPSNAHLNWLRETGAGLGLEPMELGRWKSGSKSTKRFLRGLERSYGSADPNVAAGASFAIETWAAFGIGCGVELESRNFWKQLIDGLERFNGKERLARGLDPLALGFFKYHFQVESGHGANVWRELEHDFGSPGFSAARFLKGGLAALDSIELFWKGLDESRRAGQSRASACAESINIAQWAF